MIIVLLSIVSGLMSNSLNDHGIPLLYRRAVLAGTELSVHETKTMRDRGEALLIDAREEAEYARDHIPKAVNIPYNLNRTKKSMIFERIARETNIIVYCQDPTCNAAEKVAGELRYAGFEHVGIMTAGLDGWLAEGFPLESE